MAGELNWFKARQSIASGACVELATDGELVALRNSRDPEIVLRFTKSELGAFVDGAIRGEFNQFFE